MEKTDKIVFATYTGKYDFMYNNWYEPLKKVCKNLISFNTRKYTFLYGREAMNDKFLKVIEKEKPDYILFYLVNEEFYLETLLKIRMISPKTKIVNLFSDDDINYDNFSRYMALFCDYILMAQPDLIYKYKKDGFKNIFPLVVANADTFKPLNIKKKYDVTFIGKQKYNRAEFIRYLLDNGINVHVFGWDWNKLPEFKNVQHGIPDNEEMVKIINQTRINLSFTENKFGKRHYKGRFFEISACKSFAIEQFFKGYLKFFKNNKEIVMYKDKEDLLKKVKYYLSHEKEREEIAARAYKKIKQEYDINVQLKKFITQTKNEETTHLPFSRINKKILTVHKEDMDDKEILNMVRNYDYIAFDNGKCKNYPLKNYLQAYSLEKSNKDISCCSYYVSSKLLDRYLLLFLDDAMVLPKFEREKLFNINQLMVKREFFIQKMSLFRQIFNGKRITFIDDKNMAVIAIPLVDIEELPTKDYALLKKVFRFKFPHKLYSLFYQKKFFSAYPLKLMLEILKGNFFILKVLIDVLNDSSRIQTAEHLKKG